MKIGINAHSIGFTADFRRSGTSRYADNLLRALSRIDSVNQYRVYVRPEERLQPLGLGPNFEMVHASWNTSRAVTRIVWENTIGTWQTRSWRPDVYHSLLNVAPLWLNCPSVVTIHDLGAFRYPAAYTLARRYYQQLGTRRTARRATAIITPTEAIALEVQKHFAVPAENICVTGEGVSTAFSPQMPATVRAWRQANAMPESFFLFVGNLEPRKNLASLLRAFAELKKRAKGRAPADLVIVGSKAWKYDETLALIPELGIADQVHLRGFVPDEELPLLYSAACCLVYPSLYEGFGLPPLEAMSGGCPVITSLDSALVEVGGTATRALDPFDTSGFADELQRMATDIAYREKWIAKGLERASLFSWEKAAQRTLELYARVALRRPAG